MHMDDLNPEQTNVIDPASDIATTPQGVEDLLTVQNAVKTRMDQLDKLREEIKPHKEMLDSYLENDQTYQEKVAAAKKASQEKSAVKNKLLKQPQAAQLVDKIKTIKDQMKDIQEGLSYYLREYQRMTGANEVEGSDGELRQIVYVAKLVRKTNINRE